MKLLIITQTVDENHPTLGFFVDWLREFSRHYEKLIVICLQKGNFNLPPTVKVESLGKEAWGKQPPSWARLYYIKRFFTYLWRYRGEYQAVFVHMNQIYVLLAGWWWKLGGKRVCLWYAHGKVSFSLRLAEKLADVIVTSTPEGCRLKSGKVVVVGQGIDFYKFAKVSLGQTNKLRIVSVGRISPVKDFETLIKSIGLLKQRIPLKLTIVGGPGTPSQEEYAQKLRQMVRERELEQEIEFSGALPPAKIPEVLAQADFFVSPSQTGSLDKAALEAMAAGLPVITANEAVAKLLEPWRGRLVFSPRDFRGLAAKIESYYYLPLAEKERLGSRLRELVIQQHSLQALIEKINRQLKV